MSKQPPPPAKPGTPCCGVPFMPVVPGMLTCSKCFKMYRIIQHGEPSEREGEQFIGELTDGEPDED